MKKVPSIKTVSSKGVLSTMNVVQLLGYADIANSMMDKLFNEGRHWYNAQYCDLISVEDNRDVTGQLQEQLTDYSRVHNELVKEIGDRFKKDMKLSKSPIQVDRLIVSLKEKHEKVGKVEPNELQKMAQEKYAKDMAESNKKSREADSKKKVEPAEKKTKVKTLGKK